ncbi:MAG: hypothetical protein AAFX06_03360 [Planctomycetota bacterium]
MKTALPLVAIATTLALVGCNPQPAPEESAATPGDIAPDKVGIRSAAELAASGETPEVGEDAFGPSGASPEDRTENTARMQSGGFPAGAPRPSDLVIGGDAAVAPLSELTVLPTPAGVPEAGQPPQNRKLRSDLSVSELELFLEHADRNLKIIASGNAGQMTQAEAVEQMRQIERNKLQASLQLKNHAEATDRQRVDGARGQLQALSHLAAMGDLVSAKALKLLAIDNLDDADPGIVMDSRIVLIGFEIDALQSGDDEAADRIVQLVNDLSQHQSVDIPAILTMGQARQILSSYGQVDQAQAVRNRILELYGSSPDPIVAKVAAEAAGSVKFDVAERLVLAILERDDVKVDRWSDTAIELATESPDMSVVQYLAGAALRFESVGRDAFVDETFRILEEQFTEPDAATTREIAMAKRAREARRSVVGRLFAPDLPSVDGRELKIESYRGKVILMPFWAIRVPESLQIVGQLKAIRDANPDQVAIVGMNLDSADAPLPEFLAQADLDFQSYQSVSSVEESGANPVAEQFGLVSLPFVVILNQEARVVALDFTGTKVQKLVDELIQDDAEDASNPE